MPVRRRARSGPRLEPRTQPEGGVRGTRPRATRERAEPKAGFGSVQTRLGAAAGSETRPSTFSVK